MLIGWRAWRHARQIASSSSLYSPANAAARTDNAPTSVYRGRNERDLQLRRERDRAEFARRQAAKEELVKHHSRRTPAENTAAGAFAPPTRSASGAANAHASSSRLRRDLDKRERQASHPSGSLSHRDASSFDAATTSTRHVTPERQGTERYRSAYRKKPAAASQDKPVESRQVASRTSPLSNISEGNLADLAMSFTGKAFRQRERGKATSPAMASEDIHLQQILNMQPAERYDEGELDEAAMFHVSEMQGQYVSDEQSDSDLDYQAAVEDLWQQNLDEKDELEAADLFGAALQRPSPSQAPSLPDQIAHINRSRSLTAPQGNSDEGYGRLNGEIVPTRFDFSSHVGEDAGPRQRRHVRRVGVNIDKLQPGDKWHEEVASYRDRQVLCVSPNILTLTSLFA